MATTFHRTEPKNLGKATDIIRIVHALEGVALDIRAVESMLNRLSILTGGVHVWVIEHEGATAGYMLVEVHPRAGFLWREASIHALYVRPAFRQHGIAAKARVLARDEASHLGACLRWRQMHREDAALVPASRAGTTFQPQVVAA